MRIVARSAVALAAAVILSSSLLTGCTADSSWFTGQSPTVATVAPTTTPPADLPTPTPTPTPSAEPTSELPRVVLPAPGDCPLEGRLVTFIVTADDDTTPIEITYPGFTPAAAAPEARTVTAFGPVVTVLQHHCVSGPESEPWPFTASRASGDYLGCAVFFGGMLIRTGSDYTEGATRELRVDCTSHPGM
jgi:hypothetical protein